MSKRIQEVSEDIKEIRRVLTDNTYRLAEYNAQLDVHIKATRNLEKRIEPIEDHVKFLRSLSKMAAWAAGICGSLAGIAKYLFFK